MSKRSVDKGDRGKKTSVDAKDANPRDASSTSLEKMANARSKADMRQSSKIYSYSRWILPALLSLAALLSLYLRAYIPWNRVFSGNSVIFSSESDAWYHMMLAKGVVINLQRLWFDPMTNFPHGTPLHFGPFLDWAIAIFSYILGLGYPSMHLVEVVGAYMPAVLGALLVFPVYFIGKELGGRGCGFVSALIVAVLPGQIFSRTTLGFTDHHGAEMLLSTLTMMFLLMAVRSGRSMTFAGLQKDWSQFKNPLLYAALAGVSLGLYIDAWSSGFLFEGIILLFIFLQSIFDHIKGKNIEYLSVTGAITFFVATLVVLPFVKPALGFNHYLYSLFQPTILILGVVAVIIFALLSRYLRENRYDRYYYPGAMVGATLLGTLILYAALPQFIEPLRAGLNIFQQKTGGASTVGEASPLFSDGGAFSVNNVIAGFPGIISAPDNLISLLFSTFTFALVALVLLLVLNVKNQKPTDIMILTWSLVILVMAIAQNRFTYYYGINVAILTGFLAIWVFQKLGLSEMDLGSRESKDPITLITSNFMVVVAAVVIFALVIWPSLSLSTLYARSAGGPDPDWLTSTAWLQNNTPSPGMDLYEKYEMPASGQYEYPNAAYGIMSWWDYGHLIETIGHRIPNANPFQQGIGSVTANVPGSSPFFLAENESQAEKVLAELDLNRSRYMNTKYVMIDQPMATGKFHAMAAWSNLPYSKYMALVYQQQGDQLVPTQLWRESYTKSMTARMFFFDGTEVVGDQGVGLAYRGMDMENGFTVPVLTEAPMITKDRAELDAFINDSRNRGDLAEIAATNPYSRSFPLEALQHFRLVHESETVTTNGQKVVKIFENVPGAVIKGSAPAGTKVIAAVPIMTNQNRAFIYQQSNTSDASGQFTLVLPYSTEGPAANGTKFDTKPMSGYQLSIENKTYGFEVPEEYVLSGTVVNVAGSQQTLNAGLAP